MNSTGTRKSLILALACLAQFMVVLDIAIVNVALPAIQQEFDLRQSTLQWVVIAYGLMLGGFLLLGGRLGDMLGRRRILLVGLAIFSSASLLAGLAQSAEILIGARALQGFGAALIAPSALAIVAVTFSEGKERNSALGIFGAVGGTSASVGVIASGLLTDGPGWRWIFFINVPIGVFLIALAAKFLPSDRIESGARRYDAFGASAITGSIVLLIYGLNRGVDHGWGAAATISLFALSAMLMLLFVRIESRAADPLVPGVALKNRMMVAADLAAFLLFGAFFAFIFLGSLLMQELLGYSPTKTGVAWLATSVMAFVVAGVTGARLVPRFGIRRLVIAGTVLIAIGGAWLTRVSPGANYLTSLLPAFLVMGVAIGLLGPSLQIGALTGVADRQAGLASGLVETMREIGGAVGIAAVSTVLASHARSASDLANPAARQAAVSQGFQSAFVVIVVLAVLGAITSTIAFPRQPQSQRATESSDEQHDVLSEAGMSG
jgi:EmrB/QacA subfamily drug resistance transporter